MAFKADIHHAGKKQTNLLHIIAGEVDNGKRKMGEREESRGAYRKMCLCGLALAV